jgi:hypothetical protein
VTVVKEPSRVIRVAALVGCWLLLGGGAGHAQLLQANDNELSVPYGLSLVVDAFGVLDNDILDGENAGENGATAELVQDVSHGSLALGSDGSFTYTVGPTFEGSDQFVYRAVFGAVSSQATVTLTACEGGPPIYTCWKEAAFLALAAANGFPSFQESFENDAVWGGARHPNTVQSVSSRGFAWRANDFDPTHVAPPFPESPPSNHITTGPGAARTGMWGIFDLAHGYAVGSFFGCDVEMPDPNCFQHDGMTVAREPGSGPLHGAGGYLRPSNTADVAIVIDGDWQNPTGGGVIFGSQFFGVIDTGPIGFDEIQFREVDGRITDQFIIFADDFTLLAEPVDVAVPSLDALGLTALGCLLCAAAARSLRRGSSAGSRRAD